MQAPPPLPVHRLRRVLSVARGDGWSLVIVAALGGLYTAVRGGWVETAGALLVVLAGAGELHGRRRLLGQDLRGVSWLVGSQLFLLAVIWAYAWWRWRFFDPAALWAEFPAFARTELDRQMLAAGLAPEFDRPLVLQMMNTLTCLLLAFLTLLYQGGLAAYYALNRRTIAEALLASPPPVS
ncbi:MAG: hypothetical protein ACOZE5_18580 [Verrucomicrobiota bacterium]